MKLNSIDLNNIKIVIFDFDDTLAIHIDKDFIKHRNESKEKRLMYYLNAYRKPEMFYDEIELCTKSETLYKFIEQLRDKNIKMYCLSGMKFSFNFKAKQNFINRHYGDDIELISCASQELKLDSVKTIQMIHNCKLEEILFIDDREDVVVNLSNNGIKSILVGEFK